MKNKKSIAVHGKPLDQYSDQGLVKVIVNTEDQTLKKEAFSIIVERNYESLRNFIRRIMGNNDSEVDDVLHNALIKAYENLQYFVAESKVSTWLHTIAKNEVVNLARTAKARPPSQDIPFLESYLEYEDDEIEQEDLVEAFTDPETPESIYESVELIEQIEAAVDEMEEKYQAMYRLRYIDQKEYHEIAEELNMPIGTVKKRLYELNLVIKDIINNAK